MARLLVLVAFLVIGNPLYFLGSWLGLKVFSLFVNIFLSNGIPCFRFFSVARRNTTPHHQSQTMHPYTVSRRTAENLQIRTLENGIFSRTFDSERMAIAVANEFERIKSASSADCYQETVMFLIKKFRLSR